MEAVIFTGRSLVPGLARGSLLLTDTPLSFWGGVDPATGIVIDEHHPLKGECVKGRILALPSSRGSCSGSGVMLELLLNGAAPAALVCCEPEQILTLGIIIADELFDCRLPVLQLNPAEFASLVDQQPTTLHNNRLSLTVDESSAQSDAAPASAIAADSIDGHTNIQLSPDDQAMLSGSAGRATQVAMQVLLRMAEIQQATHLIDVSQVHIDACIYSGPSSLLFAQRLLEWDARVCVPTTLNAISVDQRRWQMLGVDPALGRPASELGDAYMAMGAAMSFTCAPYQLDSAPALGEDIGWAESNAVVYANSVIGARTQKYADFLDVCIALTGRAPAAGAHLPAQRLAGIIVDVQAMPAIDDSFWPLLGLHIGTLAVHRIPMVNGLAHLEPGPDDMKAFSAAFATTSAAPMFHLAGLTPEADDALPLNTGRLPHARVTHTDLLTLRASLNTAADQSTDLVCLGNPHFSLTECARLAQLCEDRTRRRDVAVLVTLSRYVYGKADAAGLISRLERFGVQFITDTCWCMLGAPVVPPTRHAVMTNSGKFAHYAPGLIRRAVRFGSLAQCVDAACEP